MSASWTVPPPPALQRAADARALAEVQVLGGCSGRSPSFSIFPALPWAAPWTSPFVPLSCYGQRSWRLRPTRAPAQCPSTAYWRC